ncbi:MAG TPA: hypothetical protein VKR06_32525 [Ktedonosporobacter sp.]|nr:hypothetical protein [Ktedonosporobacter sp.]
MDIRLVDKMFSDLQQHDNKALLDSSAVLASLAFERYNGDEQWLNWRIEMIDNLENLRIFQEYRQKGEEGEAQKILIRFVSTRFPSLSTLAKEQASLIHSLTVLEDLIIKMGTVSRAREARSYLTEWEEIYKEQLKNA